VWIAQGAITTGHVGGEFADLTIAQSAIRQAGRDFGCR
jgi:hypothetical protein